jgi:inner membrane protein
VDNLTHTLFAITLRRTALGRAGRGATAALVIASNAPDVDIVTTAGGAVSYLRWHRGPTHGPIGIVSLGIITAALVWLWPRATATLAARKGQAPPLVQTPSNPYARFHVLVGLSIVGVILHVLMDLPTSYGTRLLSPFDWHWYAFDWLPIIDIYVLIVLIAGLAFGRASEEARRRNAAIALVLMAANYGLRAESHHQALALAPRLFGPALPAPCGSEADAPPVIDRWPRDRSTAAATRHEGRRCLIELAAIPTFASPFHWRIIAQMSNAYEIHDVDLLDPRVRHAAGDSPALWRVTRRFPNEWTPAVEHAAAASVVAQTFFGFSRFPRVRSFVDGQGVAVVSWTDMRFVVDPVALDQPVRRPSPFTATVRLAADGRVLQQSLGR